MIRRPGASSTVGHIASPSIISIADSSKHIIQIMQLLDERNLTFSFCMNKNELLTFCGLSLLYQGLDLKQEGKLMLDNKRLVVVVVHCLNKAQARGAADFTRLAASLFGLEKKGLELVTQRPVTTPVNIKPAASRPPLKNPATPNMKNGISMSEANITSRQEKLRRMTLPNLSTQRMHKPIPQGRRSFDLAGADSPVVKQEYTSPPRSYSGIVQPHSSVIKPPQLDYLSLNPTPEHSQPQSPILSRNPTSSIPSQRPNTSYQPLSTPSKTSISLQSTDWDPLISSLDIPTSTFYDSPFSAHPLSLSMTDSQPSSFDEWSPESWDVDALSPYEYSMEQDRTKDVVDLI